MARKNRTHLLTDSPTPDRLAPAHMVKQDFARRLYKLMLGKGWNQSELARQAGLTRDSISTYINARVLPSPESLEALAAALGVEAAELMPNHVESAIDADMPAFEMRSSPNAPHVAWVRINRLVTMKTALAMAQLLENDNAVERAGSGEPT